MKKDENGCHGYRNTYHADRCHETPYVNNHVTGFISNTICCFVIHPIEVN